MNTFLLYPDKEWDNSGSYFDFQSIVQDLGLNTLFRIAACGVEKENGEIKSIMKADNYILESVKRVMSVPLTSEEEIVFRNEMVKDCVNNEEFIRELYQYTSEVLQTWDKLGRRISDKRVNKKEANSIITDLRILYMFVDSVEHIQNMLNEQRENLHAKGFLALIDRLQECYSPEFKEDMNRIINSISFYVDNTEENQDTKKMVKRPKIVFSCSVGEGLKLSDMKLEEVESELVKYRDPKSTIGKVQEYMNSLTPDSFKTQTSVGVKEQTAAIEYQIVQYIYSSCYSFVNFFTNFFDQLHFQSAFYCGAVNLHHHMGRFEVSYCYPKVGSQWDICFDQLKEFVMCVEQRVNAIGNTCYIKDKKLLIVTGANQGGKSTFLRSIGIAQIMMQSGLFVAATYYESGIFPNFYTHFTRREDSEMNSGRLDEELGRMSQIIDHLGKRSLILLNESFATTTEKEGSVIAYDIIKALNEHDVKVLTVTHLLSFAQKVYKEKNEKEERKEKSEVEFLSAERLSDGKRTFKMIQHAPEMTSFGLDIYYELIQPK